MKKNDLKKLLNEEIYANVQLHDFCVECIEHIFKENAEDVLEEFNSIYDSIDEGYGLSLECMISNEERRKNTKQ